LWSAYRRESARRRIDRTRATAEYLAEFRTDVEGFVALEVVESCVGDHREMLPAAGITYRALEQAADALVG
jgi:hypothetical protein